MKRELVMQIASYWRKILGVEAWDIDFRLRDEDTDKTIAGETTADWRYLTATIALTPDKLNEMSDKEAEGLIVHEYMHVILDEMKAGGVDHEERVATMLERAFMRLREAVR
jgi:hypothetical protein